MTPEEFRRGGHALIDWVADYRARLAERPVMASTQPGDIKRALPPQAPLEGESFEAILADLERIVLPGITHWQHPRFFGYFPANAELASVLADLASAGIGAVGVSWQSSPALAEVEEVVTDWLRQLFGLSERWSGAIHGSASLSTLVALLCARERSSDYGAAGGGLQSEPRPLVVYTSEQAHSSVEKAAALAGFGRANLRVVPHDAAFALRPAALAEAIRADRAAGCLPSAVVATVGSTATTALDPIEAIAAIARREGLWLHVDAAMAGTAMLLPECRWMWQGIEGADSLVVNPHKWLGAAFDCSLYYVTDPLHLVRVMGTNPSYLRSAVDEQVRNLRDWDLPLGRRFRALKLWFLLREQGVRRIQERLRRDLANARLLAELIAGDPAWRVVAPVSLQTVCLRHEPPGVVGEALERHTQAWAERLNRSGRAFVTPAKIDGRWMVRISVGALTTERSDIEALWRDLQATAAGTL